MALQIHDKTWPIYVHFGFAFISTFLIFIIWWFTSDHLGEDDLENAFTVLCKEIKQRQLIENLVSAITTLLGRARSLIRHPRPPQSENVGLENIV
jgi:hypothetical protein